ncbi:glucose-1-phosphate adenylyltransferase subunit GlgD [Paradesulfitobacterium aromaticivorans]
MTNAIGIIFTNSEADSMQGLALTRPIAALPFGGRYRILDFALSSMVNSGIKTIGLVTSHHYRALLDHLGAGKDWFLDRKNGGLFILPGVMHGLVGNEHAFCIKDLYHNIEYLRKDHADQVVISRGDQIFNLNFKDILEFHTDKRADVTLIYQEMVAGGTLRDEPVLKFDKNQKVSAIQRQQDGTETEPVQPCFVNLLIIRRKLLLEIIARYSPLGCMNLLDILTANLQILNIYGSPTRALVTRIRTVTDYFHHSMDLLQRNVCDELWLGADPIYTKIVDNSPTRYTAEAKVSNSLIASGCSIAGEVVNSIVFRGVIFERGCRVKNSIIMPKCRIHAHAEMDYAILDQAVEVDDGNVLKGSANNPLVILNRTAV